MLKLYKNKGFTLIELLVVISIIGLLSTVIMTSLSSAKIKAQNTKFIADMNQLKMAFELYRNDKGFYPGENHNEDGISGISTVEYDTSQTLSFLQGELVPKYISSISQYVPGNTIYQSGGFLDSGFYSCGGVLVKDYLYWLPNSSSLNFPEISIGGDVIPNFYCIGQ